MNYKSKLLQAISEMNEIECKSMFENSAPTRFKMNEKQNKCNHSMKYDMATGGSTCTLCHWMS